MDRIQESVSGMSLPGERSIETLDARELPPPEPLTETLERLPELDDRTVLVQINDRLPQLLFPKLEERGFAYDSDETDDGFVTAIWRP